VLNNPGENVRDGLNATVRVPREASSVILGPVATEIVKKQEGIKLIGFAEAETTSKSDTGTFHGGLRSRN
jgi:hypothetical protein